MSSRAQMVLWYDEGYRKAEIAAMSGWVSRLWRENDLKPWQQGTFKISRDPHFEDKVRDVVDLYLDPPEGEVVVSVDAKSGIQALDRTQPLLPIDFGKTQKRTFDYEAYAELLESMIDNWRPRSSARWSRGPSPSSA